MLANDLLQGDRVRLTALRQNDLPALTAWQDDADFLRHLDATAAAPKTEQQMAGWLARQTSDPNSYMFAIRPVEGEDLLGYVVLDGILWNHRVCWLTIAIGPRESRGHGYGREAMRLVLGFAFRELNLHRVQLSVFGYNQRAIRLYEALGFRREGAFREFLQRDDQRFDMLLYGLLAHEWRGAQA